MTATSIGHRPDGAWAFDASVAHVFEDMLARSIPGYGDMRRIVTALACRYYQAGTALVDLGASQGGAIAPILDACPTVTHAIAVEVSEPMRNDAAVRFAGDERVTVVDTDLRHGYPDVTASVTLAVLTLQFVPIEYRPRLLGEILEHSVPGAVLLVVEKVIGSTPEVNEALTDLYLTHKRDAGYSEGDIAAKRVSLEGVLVPVTARENTAQLRAAGFVDVDCIWRSLNFAGWMARVPPRTGR
jgi:tRNA (cmo5U34)-methyltransferase